MEINDITYKVRGAIFAVYNALGPGLLESVYELALMHELRKQGLKVEHQVKVDVYYGWCVVANRSKVRYFS